MAVLMPEISTPSSAVEYFKVLLEEQTKQGVGVDVKEPVDPKFFQDFFNLGSVSPDVFHNFSDINVKADPGNFLGDGQNYTSEDNAIFDSLGNDFDFDLFNDSLHIAISPDDLNDLKDFVGKFKTRLDTINPISDGQFVFLSLVYLLFIIFGFLGNVLVLWAVLGRENMRTARNVFIVTLAISDLLLCFFTMPSKLWEVLYRRWPFGPDTQWLCQLASAGQTAPIFMSSLSIVAIALDRYRCILQPDLDQVSVTFSVTASVAMAALSGLMSVPLFTGTQLRSFVSFNKTSMEDILVCSDDRVGSARTAYNLSATFVQFVLPLLFVFAVYLSIFARLRNRPQSQHSENNRRRRRTNVMIILISVTFFLSWLPLNVLNTILDFSPEFIETYLGGQDRLVYGICNILGLSNACINPLIYGYLNENFRKEYKSIYQRFPWHSGSSFRHVSHANGDWKRNGNRFGNHEQNIMSPKSSHNEESMSKMSNYNLEESSKKHVEMKSPTPTSTSGNKFVTPLSFLSVKLGFKRGEMTKSPGVARLLFMRKWNSNWTGESDDHGGDIESSMSLSHFSGPTENPSRLHRSIKNRNVLFESEKMWRKKERQELRERARMEANKASCNSIDQTSSNTPVQKTAHVKVKFQQIPVYSNKPADNFQQTDL